MNTRCLVSAASSLWILLGCNTPPAATPTPATTGPEPRVSDRHVTRLAASGRLAPLAILAPPQPCYVGTKDCVDLDSTPFGLCLLSSNHCPSDVRFIPLEPDNIARGMVLEPYAFESSKR